MTEVMLRDTAAAHGLNHVICGISTSPAPILTNARGNRLQCDASYQSCGTNSTGNSEKAGDLWQRLPDP